MFSEEGFGRLILQNDIVLDEGLGGRAADGEQRVCMSDFRYLKEMGRGEQGRIFLVTHTPSGTPMAIKVRTII